jgi:pantetheine-phosphate adenylyltransferase
MSAKRIAVYPASFDPITNGHVDIIDRAAKLFDELIVAIGINVDKPGTFSHEERLEMLHEVLADRPNVGIASFSGLLVDFLRQRGSRIVIRGLRALADFEYEFEMALMNAHLFPEIETVFLMTSERWFYVSSSRLRELLRFGTDIGEFVPAPVYKRMRARFASLAKP